MQKDLLLAGSEVGTDHLVFYSHLVGKWFQSIEMIPMPPPHKIAVINREVYLLEETRFY